MQKSISRKWEWNIMPELFHDSSLQYVEQKYTVPLIRDFTEACGW